MIVFEKRDRKQVRDDFLVNPEEESYERNAPIAGGLRLRLENISQERRRATFSPALALINIVEIRGTDLPGKCTVVSRGHVKIRRSENMERRPEERDTQECESGWRRSARAEKGKKGRRAINQ